MRDWAEWHRAYDDPTSRLARRLEVVRGRLSEALGAVTAPSPRLLSLCAGEGRDVIPALATREPSWPGDAVLVEIDPSLARRAVDAAAIAGVDAVHVRCGDAADPGLYADLLPVDLLLLCGIFGNIDEQDIQATIAAVPALVAPGGFVIWTRGRSEPDLRPCIREWFSDAGLSEVSFDGAPETFGVGVARMPIRGLGETPVPRRLFTFVG